MWRGVAWQGAAAAVAVLGPALVGLAAVYTSSHGTHSTVLAAAALALVATVAALGVLFRQRARVLCAVALLPSVLLAGFLGTYRASPLPAPPPFAGAWPAASPPAGMALYQLPTGVIHRSASFGYRGGSLFEDRVFTMTALLVRHPRGDLLIDTGFGREIDRQLSAMPRWFRAATRVERGRSAAEQLDAAGYDRKALRAVLLTHAHWDHVSGLPELAGTPVWLTAEERRFVDEGARTGELTTAVARTLPPLRYEELRLDGPPYLGFPRSHDVYGDGAIVVVPQPGHTPGSVIVFLSLPDGRRYALVGDLAWQREGITEREERPWQARAADADPQKVREGLLHLAALAARFPELILVPAHDARAFAGLPLLQAGRR